MRQTLLSYLTTVVFIVSSGLFAPSAHAVAEELLMVDTILSGNQLSGNQSSDDQLANNTATANDDTSLPTPTDDIEINGTIESNPALINDDKIAERIRGIFAEVDGLMAVTVTVNEGVVKLSGETANEKKATQAVKLASRVSNVVTVEDGISRTLDVQDNVTPVLNNLYIKAKGWLRAMPLMLVAILAFGLMAWFGGWLATIV